MGITIYTDPDEALADAQERLDIRDRLADLSSGPDMEVIGKKRT
jgi:hypothetical protein